MKHSILLCAIILAALCLGQTYTLEIHAAIDGEPGYCDSLLSLTGAIPAAGTHDIPAGDSVTISIDTTLVEVAIGTRDSCYGWNSIASASDSTHGEGLSLSFVMTGNTVVIWNFKRQFMFEVTCSYDYDSPEPYYGIHWFDKGDSITASIDMMVGDTVCLGYIGTGSVDVGHFNSWTGILEEPSSIQWIINYVHPVCSLLVISEHGPCTPPASDYWIYFFHGTEFVAFTSAVDSSDSALGIIYTCIGWRGEGCVPATGPTPYVPPYNVCEITCTNYGILEWLWDTVATGIEEDNGLKPLAYEISAYPNPFNSAVTIAIDGAGVRDTPLRVEIYDVAGRQIAVIPDPDRESSGAAKNLDSRLHGNDREIIWRPDKDLPSGIYFVRLLNENDVLCGKVVYLR